MGHYHSYSSTRGWLPERRKSGLKPTNGWRSVRDPTSLSVMLVLMGMFFITTRGVTVKKATGQKVQIHAEAGEDWDDFVAHTLAQGVRGLETLSGIPGTVGASVIQNVGAYGAEVSDTLVSIDFLEFPSGKRSTVPSEELALGHRTSALKTGKLQGIVLGVTFSLEPAEDSLSIPIRYDQLADALGVTSGERAPLATTRETVRAIRSTKGMLLDSADPDSVSSGSFFMNPVVSERSPYPTWRGASLVCR